jgi:hypothetical protein
MKNVGMFYGHLVYFAAIWSILRPFGLLYGHLVYILPFWYIVPKKSGNLGVHSKIIKVQVFFFLARIVSRDCNIYLFNLYFLLWEMPLFLK